MKTDFDPSVIQVAADALYKRADSIIAGSVGLGMLTGGFPIYAATHKLWAAAVGALIAGIVGYGFGTGRAFALRLQAQTALCQLRIEHNTRKEPDA